MLILNLTLPCLSHKTFNQNNYTKQDADVDTEAVMTATGLHVIL